MSRNESLTRPDAGIGPQGILLVNVGSPDDPSPGAVARFLRSFLGDPAVMRMPAPLRFLLVRGIIAPLRSRRSAQKYARIWTKEGSPLLLHSRRFAEAFARATGSRWIVRHAMRYGHPSLAKALAELRAAGATRVAVLPLFPQAAGATSGTIRTECFKLCAGVRDLRILQAFHAWPPYLDAQAARIREGLDLHPGASLLLTYHGLPVKHLDGPDCRPEDPHGACCKRAGSACYRAQCLATSEALIRRLGIDASGVFTSFQSRLGPGRWIGPSTRSLLDQLPARGVKSLVVAAPSFVADCLETLEEITMEGRSRFLLAGGESFEYIECLNEDPAWVKAAVEWVEAGLRDSRRAR